MAIILTEAVESHVGKTTTRGFPEGSAGKESACKAGDPGSIPGLGRSPGEGKGYTLQYSRLEKSMDRGAWQATVLGVAESEPEQLSMAQHNGQLLSNQGAQSGAL